MVTQTPAGPDDIRGPNEQLPASPADHPPVDSPPINNPPVDSSSAAHPPKEPSAPARPIAEHPGEQNSG